MGRKAVSKLFYYLSILLTGLLSIITLAGALSSFVSPTQCIILAFIGLAMPVLLLLNAGLIIYWCMRCRIWLLLPFIAILGNWGYMSRVLRFSNPNVSKSTLIVSTYNVDGFNRDLTGYTCKEIARYMKNEQVDILCIQEFAAVKEFSIDSIKAAFSAWHYVAIPQPTDGKAILQVAVFSKYPISHTHLVTYPDSKNCSMWCDLDINGQNIRIFNNHLQTTEVSSNKVRLEKELHTENITGTEYAMLQLAKGLKENFIKRATQAEHMQKLIAASPYPTLVCGDFNSLPSSYTYHIMKGTKLSDGFLSAGHGYMYTFRYFKKLLRIDYIFHSKEFKVEDYVSPYLDYSDHKPVMMKIELTADIH